MDRRTFIKNVGTIAEQQVEAYFEILGAVLEGAITAGDVYDNLTMFYGQAQVVKGTIGEVCNIVDADDVAYLAEIDEKDEYLY